MSSIYVRTTGHLLIACVLLAATGCGPKWNQSSKTVDQAEFISHLQGPRIYCSHWNYDDVYGGFHYLEYWSTYTKTWAEYRYSVRSRGEEVDRAVAEYQVKLAKEGEQPAELSPTAPRTVVLPTPITIENADLSKWFKVQPSAPEPR